MKQLMKKNENEWEKYQRKYAWTRCQVTIGVFHKSEKEIICFRLYSVKLENIINEFHGRII